jgi:hypothetical protein
LGWRSAGSQPAAFQNKGEQGDQDKKSRDVKKPIVMQVIPRRARWTAVAMSFVWVMMVLAHYGFLGRSIFRCESESFLAALILGIVPMFSSLAQNFHFQQNRRLQKCNAIFNDKVGK